MSGVPRAPTGGAVNQHDDVGLERSQAWLRFLAAVLFAIGIVTGPLVALAMTDAIPADGGSMLAAHLNALLGAFWLLAVAWTLPHVRVGERGRQALVGSCVLANYANWVVTVLKAFLGVRGLAYTGAGGNDLVATLLLLLVVLPSLVCAGLWAFGLRPKGGAAADGG